MKVIDLLNKIAKGEEVPKKIKFRGFDMIYDNCTTDYEPQNTSMFNRNNLFHYLFEEETNFLNDEIEIIEEKPKHIEDVNYDVDCTDEWNFGEIYDKLNEISKAVNYLLDKEQNNE